jgi:hypothetical protein
MTTPAIPRLLACGSYHPGHDVHWIQAKRSHEPPAVECVASVGTDGWVTVTRDAGDSQRVWNHDPGRLAALLARTAGRAVLRSHNVLAVPSADGHYCISVASASSPCPEPDEDLGELSLGEQVLRRGGFSVPASEMINSPRRAIT